MAICSHILSMTMARTAVVLENEAGIYHCVSRCVRRAFLCGWDPYSGKNYQHRKGWVQQRVRELSSLFAVEVCAYAVMSNHLHLVLRSDPREVLEWSDEKVAGRWFRLFPGGRDSKGEPNVADPAAVRRFLEDAERIRCCRARLGNLSWFMRCLNERIARRANREDACTGRFWEGRFKCQRLEDEGAVLACMAYVDLNPVRAGLADCPGASDLPAHVTEKRGDRDAVTSPRPKRSPANRRPSRSGCSSRRGSMPDMTCHSAPSTVCCRPR